MGALRGLKVPLPILFMLLMLLVIISVFDILKKSYDVHSEANRRVATAILENTLTRANSGLNGIAARIAAQDPDLDSGPLPVVIENDKAVSRDFSGRALILRFDGDRALREARLGAQRLAPPELAALQRQPAIARMFDAPASGKPVADTQLVLLGGIPYMLSDPHRGRTADGGRADIVIGLPVREMVFEELEKYEVFRSGNLHRYLERQNDFAGLAALIVDLQNREYAQFHFSAVAQIVVVLVAFVIAVIIGHHVDEAGDALRRSRDLLAEREQEAQRLRQLAEQASAAKSQFIHNMSHELRTPLNAILGYAELISNETFGRLDGQLGRYKDAAESIHGGGIRLLNEISKVLEYASLAGGGTLGAEGTVDLAALLKALLDDFRGLRTVRGVTLELQTEDGLPALSGNREMITGLFRHLISNAIEFSPDGERVFVSLGRADDGGLAAVVRDHGKGMDAAQANRAFEAFEHGENVFARQRQGLGLGLAIAKAYAQQHGATIAIDSAPGKGTAATVLFPAARTIGASEDTPAASASAAAVA